MDYHYGRCIERKHTQSLEREEDRAGMGTRFERLYLDIWRCFLLGISQEISQKTWADVSAGSFMDGVEGEGDGLQDNIRRIFGGLMCIAAFWNQLTIWIK
jgi:hypothetical protein